MTTKVQSVALYTGFLYGVMRIRNERHDIGRPIALTEQMDEIKHHRDKGKGRYRVDNLSHNKVAISVIHEEALGAFAARKRARDIAQEIEPITGAGEPETAENRQVKMQTSMEKSKLESLRTMDDNVVYPLTPRSGLGISSWLDNMQREEEAGPSMTYEQRHANLINDVPGLETCCACGDDVLPAKIHRLQCDHLYCHDCLRQYFMKAMSDKSIFPPKCCDGPIPLAFVQAKLSLYELDQFRKAEVEFSTTDRTYCSNADCRQFIPPSDILGDLAYCSSCGTSTCSMCKNGHGSDDCPADTALQGTLALAKRKGWPRCRACGALVELIAGCNHISYVCLCLSKNNCAQ